MLLEDLPSVTVRGNRIEMDHDTRANKGHDHGHLALAQAPVRAFM